jgi:hypothetical protein
VFWRTGAGDGVRTRDLHLGKVPLYQLSHSRNHSDYSMAHPKLQIPRTLAFGCSILALPTARSQIDIAERDASMSKKPAAHIYQRRYAKGRGRQPRTSRATDDTPAAETLQHRLNQLQALYQLTAALGHASALEEIY